MTSKKPKMYYDYRKRTSGGFFDVMFLSSLMIISLMLILINIGGR